MPVFDNPRHEIFAQGIAKGLAQREAYRRAGYSAEADAALDASASRLLRDAKVRVRIKEFQSTAAIETALTLDEHMKELKLLREMAKAEGDIKAAIQAEVKRGSST
jgi:phage terminase small subunit